MGDAKERELARDGLFLAIAVSPYFLNDILFVGVTEPINVLAIDYGTRVLAISILFLIPSLRLAVFHRERPKNWQGTPATIAYVMRAVILSILILYFIEAPLKQVFPSTNQFTYPKIESTPLFILDSTFGLFLVAVSEELAARVVFFNVLKRYTDRVWLIILISAIVFGLGHWSKGVGNVVGTTLLGVYLMWGYSRSQSLTIIVAGHFAIDFVIFAILM